MHLLFKQVADWLSYFRSPSETLIGAWFDTVWRIFEGQKAAKRMQLAGWYQTPEGLQLFPLPNDASPPPDTVPSSGLLYRVSTLALPEVRLYRSVYIVEISRTYLVAPLFSVGASDIATRELDIAIEDMLFAYNSRRIRLRHTRHATLPVWERYAAVHVKTDQPVSLYEIVLMKSIVDKGIRQAQLDTDLRSMLP